MANDEHVALLKQGTDAWNAWRHENRYIRPDLSGAILDRANLRGGHLGGADLGGAHLRSADLRWADFSGANLGKAFLGSVDLGGANLSGADLRSSDLGRANLSGADLSQANLSSANLSGANLRRADLSSANLSGAHLSEADLILANLHNAVLIEAHLDFARLVGNDFTGADLTGCRVHGASAWGLKLDSTTKQQNLVITRPDEPAITVDNIEVAQFMYLLLHNEKIREVIDTITSKTVLILGRFTLQRKAVLDAIREELRQRDYLPILFDFDKPANRDVTETISLLARMARFVVADITDAKAVPQELSFIVPHLPSVPVQPLLLKGSGEYGMFEHFARFHWLLPICEYETQDQLIASLGETVIEPAERKALEMHSGARPIPPIN
jgi:uncharacterized protein YjbI with pentapeptide repeats